MKLFKPNRHKLARAFIESYLNDYFPKETPLEFPRQFTIELSDTRKLYKGERVLAEWKELDRVVCFYTENIGEMFEHRLQRIIEHELKHMEGYASEVTAQAAETKEPPYHVI